MATYTFTVTLQGEGDTEEEAWEDATTAFSDDPGTWQNCTKEDDYEDVLKIPPSATLKGAALITALEKLGPEFSRFVAQFILTTPSAANKPLDAMFLWSDTPDYNLSGFLGGRNTD